MRLGNERRSVRWVIGCFWLVCLCTVAGANEPVSLRHATFIPLWLPQAQFAGYYVAFERGIYREHGIDLTILTGGPDHPASQALENGQAEFGTLWLSTAIRIRNHGAQIVNAAQVIQRSSLMFAAKKSSGITQPRDLNGKKVGVWEGDFLLQPLAFFKQYNLEVDIIPQAASINLLLRDGVSAAVVMWYNEYHTLLMAGLNPDELTTFFFSEHNLNFPEDGIYCRTDVDGRLCEQFAAASLEGWQYAFDHPEEALDIVMTYIAQAHLGASRVHQQWMLARMKDVIMPPGHRGFGTLQRQDYDRVATAVKDNGWIDAIPDFATFYRGTPAP
jgi:NitT/TauT family transport system substrate-binding protein